jgi:hypothetical protein
MFQWVQQHYEWVIATVVAIIAVIVALFQLIKKEPSQIAMGNNQNINAPIFNNVVNIAQPGPAPAPIPAQPLMAAAPPEPARPYIRVTSVLVTGVSQAAQGMWTENHPMQDAFIIRFTNEARAGRQNVGGLVKAQLTYRDGVRELRRITGCWLNQDADMTDFRVDDCHALMVGLMQEEQFTTVGKRRVVVDINSVEFPTDTTALMGFETGTVSVRLTHANTGDVLYEGQFFLNTHPPEIRRELV